MMSQMILQAMIAKTRPIQMKCIGHSQKGVVLVVVVLAVALMATLMALMIEDQHLFIRKVANQRVSEQGFQYANGMNAWASRVLTEDGNPVVDYLGEDWALFGRPQPCLLYTSPSPRDS